MSLPRDPIPAYCTWCDREVSDADEAVDKCVSCGDLCHESHLRGKATSAGHFCDGCWDTVSDMDKMKEARNLKW